MNMHHTNSYEAVVPNNWQHCAGKAPTGSHARSEGPAHQRTPRTERYRRPPA
jgi:hypothetical protein